jgi:hypothetical protein
MRPHPLLVLLAAPALAQAAPARAADAADPSREPCALEIATERQVVRNGDVSVLPGEPPRDVVVLNGTARVRAGAHPTRVVAVGGDVVLEEGATVDGDVTAVGGDVRLARGARVEGSATSVGGRLDVAPDAVIRGQRSWMRAEVNGVSVGLALVRAIASALDGATCHLELWRSE